MSRLIYALGRVLVPLVFIVAGYRHFLGIDELARQFADKSVPVPIQIEAWTGMARYDVLAYAAAAIEVLCGMMVLIGFKARFAAAVLFLYAAGTAFLAYDLANLDSALQVVTGAQAMKDLSIMGALLMVVGGGSGSVAFDGRSRPAPAD